MTVAEAPTTVDAAAGLIVDFLDSQWMLRSFNGAGDGYPLCALGQTESGRECPAAGAMAVNDVRTAAPAEARVLRSDSAALRRLRLCLEAILPFPESLVHPMGATLTVHERANADVLDGRRSIRRRTFKPMEVACRV